MSKLIQEKDGSVTINIVPIPLAGLISIIEPAQATINNKRYCTSCEVMRPAEYGKMIKTNKVTRWKCTACFEKINIPRYAAKRGAK